jgi:predicted dehydrogenase
METAIKLEKLKLGFLGVGWIGRNRLEAISKNNYAEVSVVSDSNGDLAKQICASLPDAQYSPNFKEMLGMGLDGIVIATPSALHAEQSIMALDAGLSVFCQKPLGRNAEETRMVIEAAKKSDKLLGVDFCYRFTSFRTVFDMVKSMELGDVYAVDLVFHNAYGPDKPWFYEPALSGGGCVIDLGVHLMDLALWTLNYPLLTKTDSSLYHKGRLIKPDEFVAEDYAVAQMETQNGTSIRLTCSWNLPAGKDAIIKAVFYGTKGAAAFENVNGSFYDFKTEKYNKTSTYLLSGPPDDWSGRAINEWTKKLYISDRYDPEADKYLAVAEAVDRIYGRGNSIKPISEPEKMLEHY